MASRTTTREEAAAYITRYDLEKHLADAVDAAIAENADNPYALIADFMNKLSAINNDDDAEDDEGDDAFDLIPPEKEPPIPTLKARGKRKQVMGASISIPANWKPPIVEKAADDEDFLQNAIATNKVFKNLAPSDQQMLLKAFTKKEFAKGDVIIKQGDPGDNFYIVGSGEADISIEGKGKVFHATRGSAFGELALLHNAPRAATVTADTDVLTWTIDMVTFKSILMGKSMQDAVDYVKFLDGMKLFDPLSNDDKQALASSLKERVWPAETNIICEGDEGDYFYIIRAGEVKCTQSGKAGEICDRLKRGDFFGELALLSSDKRKATVTAVAETTTLELGRNAFTRVFGPLSTYVSQAAAGQGRS